MESSDTQAVKSNNSISPNYYRRGDIELNDVIEAWELNFCLGNVIKYVCRAGKKDPSKTIEDLKKVKLI